MQSTGKFNGLTDVEGVLVGNFTDTDAVSGVTVVICPEGAVGAVDVRGAAPGTRETDLLAPENLVEKAQAVTLCGGSVYGLAAADGVVRWLSEKGWGFPLDGRHVAPIVSAATLYDLGRGSQFVPPISAEWGRLACEAAGSGPVSMGSVGAGTGALAGGIKSGLGTASLVLDSGITVAALMAVNPAGSVFNPATGRPWEIGLELGGEFGHRGRRSVRLPAPAAGRPAGNTTIGVVATDAALTKAQALKVAQMSHDGLARAIRPAHTMLDGDTIFCLATGRQRLPEVPAFYTSPQAHAINDIGHAAAECTARAIIHAVLHATALAGAATWADLPER
ncbi:MAG: P1 family peptidase [Hyphomicrobiales bacterium]